MRRAARFAVVAAISTSGALWGAASVSNASPAWVATAVVLMFVSGMLSSIQADD